MLDPPNAQGTNPTTPMLGSLASYTELANDIPGPTPNVKFTLMSLWSGSAAGTHMRFRARLRIDELGAHLGGMTLSQVPLVTLCRHGRTCCFVRPTGICSCLVMRKGTPRLPEELTKG